MANRAMLWLRTVLLRGRLEREMQEEMEMHLHRSTERLSKRGLPPEEARRAARLEFGNIDALQEQARDARGARWIESLLADIRFGLRHFSKMPFSTLTMIVLLALGIGFNSAVFAVIYSFARMPPPGISRNDSLVRIRGIDRNSGVRSTLGREFPYPEFEEYAARRNLFSAVAAWTSADVVLDVGELHCGTATYVTASYFQVLGIRPTLGAGLPTASADRGAPQTVGVISHAVWDRHFGKAPDIVGRRMKVNDVTITIVGVAPARFAGARVGGSQMRVWLPLNARPLVQRSSAAALASYDSALFSLGARLRPGVRLSETAATVQAIAARATQFSQRGQTGLTTDVVPLLAQNYYPPSGEAPSIGGRVSTLIIPLIILLIPCTNVSGMLVGQALRRRREIAVRLSLGAGRRRIVRQLVTESVLLALAAGGLGLFAIWVLMRALGSRFPTVQLVVDWPALVFTLAIAIVTGVLFGISPALNATRVSVAEVLKDAANAVASTRSRLQSALVVTQIALTQPLLLALGALTLNLFSDVQRLPANTFGDRILQVSFNANPRAAITEQQRASQLARVQERFAVVPGVVAVIPQNERADYAEVTVHPADQIAGQDTRRRIALSLRAAPAGFFPLMGIPFVRGRDFVRTDDNHSLVIRGDLARRLWGSADPIGRRLVGSAGASFVVVGVVDETRAGLSGEGQQHVFVPQVSNPNNLLVRTQGPAAPLAPVLRTVANEAAPFLPITSARTLASIDASERSTFRRATSAALGGGFIALLLSAIGLYAIVSFAVNQRTREIGIRTALGADSVQVVRMFFSGGLKLGALGLIVGLGISAIVIRLTTLAQGDQVDSSVVWLGALVGIVVLGVAALATWIPARRAARVDPLLMLREG